MRLLEVVVRTHRERHMTAHIDIHADVPPTVSLAMKIVQVLAQRLTVVLWLKFIGWVVAFLPLDLGESVETKAC